MKIAQIVCVYPPYAGGIGQVAYNFSRELSRHRHQVAVFTPLYGEQADFRHDQADIRHIKPVLKSGNAALMPLPGLRRFDLIIFHYPFFGQDLAFFVAYLLGRKLPPFFLHYHMDIGNLPGLNNFFSLPSRMIKNAFLDKASTISFASLDYIKNSKISGYYKNNSDRFFELPFGVDLDKFKFEARRKDKKRLLFVGGLDKAHYFKGLGILLKALKKAPQDLFLRVVGDGDLKPFYINQAAKLGLADRVDFCGRLPEKELIKEYQEAGIFVLPSINSHEAFGLVILEAMAAGTPIVASDLFGVRTVFEPGKNGFLAEPGDPDSLAKAIQSVLSSDYQAFSDRSRKIVEEKYDWKIIGDKLNKKIYESFSIK